jgi:hypothetical protein
MIVAGDHDVAVGIDADRDPDAEESSLVSTCSISAMVIVISCFGDKQVRGHTTACACPTSIA